MTPRSAECASPIHFPSAHCTRPDGHSGDHMTAEIPAPLSAVAAKMVIASDQLDAEREELAVRNAYLAHRVQRLKFAFWLFIGSTFLTMTTAVTAIIVAVSRA